VRYLKALGWVVEQSVKEQTESTEHIQLLENDRCYDLSRSLKDLGYPALCFDGLSGRPCTERFCLDKATGRHWRDTRNGRHTYGTKVFVARTEYRVMIIPTNEPDQQSKPRKGSMRPPNQILNLNPMSKRTPLARRT
jgi:hypothetical protein